MTIELHQMANITRKAWGKVPSVYRDLSSKRLDNENYSSSSRE